MPKNSIYHEGTNLELFNLAQSKINNPWEKLKNKTSNLTSWGKRILKGGLNQIAKTAVIEENYNCKDYRNVHSNFYSKKFSPRSKFCNRIHFFNKKIDDLGDIVFKANEILDSYIGFSVIQPIENRCLGRSIFDPSKLDKADEQFFCLTTDFEAHLNGAKYTASGFPYIGQTGEAIVCAHTALWNTCRYLSQSYEEYGEIYPYDLIEETSQDRGRRVPYRGMNYRDYSKILSYFGRSPVIKRPKKEQSESWYEDISTFRDLYTYIESGFPVLVSFSGHVMTIIGHTKTENYFFESHLEEKGLYDSLGYVDNYIVIDDNTFPYQELGYSSESDTYHLDYQSLEYQPSIDTIYSYVVPLPEKVFMKPKYARDYGVRWYNENNIQNEISSTLNELNIEEKNLIVRLFLTSSTSFKKRKKKYALENEDTFSLYPLNLHLPHFIWVMEVSPESLYNNGEVIGEVLFDATASEDESEIIYGRLSKKIWRASEKQYSEKATLKYPQYTHNLGESLT